MIEQDQPTVKRIVRVTLDFNIDFNECLQPLLLDSVLGAVPMIDLVGCKVKRDIEGSHFP
jgi:hypothetical protein